MAQPTSKQFPFPQLLTCRPGGAMVKDSFMKNLYSEGQGDKTYSIKRPGQGFVVSAPAGAFGWALLGMFTIGSLSYWIVADTSSGIGYILDITGGIQNTSLFPHTWQASPGDLYIWAANNYLANTGIPDIGTTLLGSYTRLWSVGGPLAIAPLPPGNMTFTAINLPTPVQRVRPGIVYLDGTAYIMDADSSQIFGSDLQQIFSWNPLNVVGTSFNTGIGTGIIRHLNYLVAFYVNGLQIFYDAGLAPPGSPLAPLPNGSFQIGCAVPETAVNVGDTLIFVSQTPAFNISVTMLQGLSFQTISTSAIDAILMDNAQYLAGPVGNAQNTPTAFGYIVSSKGHTWYILRLPSVTLAYDLTTKDWQFWTSVNLGIEGTHNPLFCLNNYAASIENGTLAQLSLYQDTIYADYNGYINCVVQTPSGDSETVFKKFQTRMNFYGDTIADTMTVAYCNDDFVTWSSPLTIDLSTQRKFVNRLGSFYHRAYQITYTGNFSFRMEKMEALLELGTA